MTLPQVQDELRQLAEQHGLPRLSELAQEMFRRKGVKKTVAKSKSVNRGVAKAIRETKKLSPDLSLQEIAVLHGVNSGRVSEALIGKRT